MKAAVRPRFPAPPPPIERPGSNPRELVDALAAIPAGDDLERRGVAARMLELWRHVHADPSGSTLRELSRISGYSPWHVQRLFKRVFGVAPHAIAARRKLEAAAQALWSSDEPVEVVSRRAGFINRCAFSRVFRQAYGVTPSDYRARRLRPDSFRDAAPRERASSTVADVHVGES